MSEQHEEKKEETAIEPAVERPTRTSTLTYENMTMRERFALHDMFDQDVLMIERSRAMHFDPRGTIRLTLTAEKDEKDQQLVEMTSANTDIAKNIIGRLGTATFAIHNTPTNRFELKDLTEWQKLEEVILDMSPEELGIKKEKELNK